ncbi:GntR family transcriptional regulator [Paracoccus cavernae]|uniref:GntR family transcriptional regulator n=1 Tax=Paracoccus cavernae TaxID=1571207 RepID=UPI0035F4D2EC
MASVLESRGSELDGNIPDQGQTRTAEILETLRNDIIEARLEPGRRLRFDELRASYDVGISPLREALMHLASEGLVIAEHRRGYRVAEASMADLQEIARLRGEFDAIALREAIARGDEEWEGRVIAAFHALSRRSKLDADGEIDRDWERAHLAFHDSLVSACPMPKLLAFRDILELQARRYRRIAVHYLKAPRDDLAEHEALKNAVIARDAQAATKLIAAHYQRTIDIISSGW